MRCSGSSEEGGMLAPAGESLHSGESCCLHFVLAAEVQLVMGSITLGLNPGSNGLTFNPVLVQLPPWPEIIG